MTTAHPSTTLFSSVTLSVGSTSTSATVNATAGSGALIEIQASVASGTQTGTLTVQPYHSPDGTQTFYPYGGALYFSPLVPINGTSGYCDWQAPPEGGEWYFIVAAATGANVTLNGRATVLTYT